MSSYSSEAMEDSLESKHADLKPSQIPLRSKSSNVPTQNGGAMKENMEFGKKPSRNSHKPVDVNFDFAAVGSGTNGAKKNGDVQLRPHVDTRLFHRESRSRKTPGYGTLASGKHPEAGWDRVGFGPLRIPLRYQLQTLLLLWHSVSMVVCLTTFFFLCAIPLLWPILLPYLIYVIFSRAATSGELSHRSERLRRSPIWSLYASYFPARLHRSKELIPTRRYIFGYHPHGIIAHGAYASFATDALGFSSLFPGITNTLLTLDSQFRIPIYRDYALAMGLASVNKESCENLLSKGGPDGEGMGRAITIVVGGARESLDAIPNSYRLVLERRKGFIKLAIRTGADLVPVLGFGENELYEQVRADEHPRVHQMQLLVKKFLGFTVPLFHARGVFNYDVGIMAYRRPLNIVVGRPIAVQKMDRPDDEYVNYLHGQYKAELQRIWDMHKDMFAPSQAGEMEIIE